jgi:hypothetical protein
MDVFVIPIGLERYELYCESPVEAPSLEPDSTGIIGRLRHRFAVMLHEAEEGRHGGAPSTAVTRRARVQERIMAWVAERIAEQRLLWNLRREVEVAATHPQDMTFDQVMTFVRGTLQRDYGRHRIWLGIDGLLLIASAALIPIPGPNIVGYYFAFRVVGHWLCVRGALQGLRRVNWTGQPSAPLSDLREAVLLEGEARDRRVHEVAERLALPHLSTFFTRVALRSG